MKLLEIYDLDNHIRFFCDSPYQAEKILNEFKFQKKGKSGKIDQAALYEAIESYPKLYYKRFRIHWVKMDKIIPSNRQK